MQDRIKIENIRQHIEDDVRIISLTLDGTDLWLKMPAAYAFNLSAEFFIACCLLEAMVSGRDIELAEDIPLSPTVYHNLETLQKIYHCWNPKLKLVQIHAPLLAEPQWRDPAVAAFFSGGIDSSYTLSAELANITHLVVLSGFDTTSKPEQWQQLVDKHQQLADQLGKKLLCIDNNLYQFSRERKIAKEFQHGLTLAGIATALGFSKVYIPSSFTFHDLFPWGSHPCTDHLWGSAHTKIVHHGAELSRTEKTAVVSQHTLIFDQLQVCWNNISYNCGHCSKCLRTMAACYLLGKHSQALPQFRPEQFRQIRLTSQAGVPFITDLQQLAERAGNKQCSDILQQTLRHFYIKLHSAALFNLLTRRLFQKLYHRLRKTAWTQYRVVMSSKEQS